MKNRTSFSLLIPIPIALLAMFIALFCTAPGWAQFYKVYDYDTTQKGEFEVALWNSYVVSTPKTFDYFGLPVDQQGLWAHALEVEYGLTDRLTLVVRTDFLDPKGAAFHYVGTRAIFFHYRLGERGGGWFDPAVLLEYSFPKSAYSDEEELELRLILEHRFDDQFRMSLNPIFKLITSGHGVEEGLELGYAAGFYYKVSHRIQPGLEFYGEIGQLRIPRPFREQEFYIFPSINLHLWKLHWNLGAGFGLTQNSNDFTIKSLIAYGF